MQAVGRAPFGIASAVELLAAVLVILTGSGLGGTPTLVCGPQLQPVCALVCPGCR